MAPTISRLSSVVLALLLAAGCDVASPTPHPFDGGAVRSDAGKHGTNPAEQPGDLGPAADADPNSGGIEPGTCVDTDNDGVADYCAEDEADGWSCDAPPPGDARLDGEGGVDADTFSDGAAGEVGPDDGSAEDDEQAGAAGEMRCR